MSLLKEKIAAFDRQKAETVPQEILTTMERATRELKESPLEGQALKTGERAPDFELPNHLGEKRQLQKYLDEAPVVLSFYRGGWCPYCNMELAALQEALPDIRRAGATLVAISPETPDHSLSTREKNDLAFDILFDEGNRVAERYGLVFELALELRPIYSGIGIDIPAHNGDDSYRIPMPATYLINQAGEIRYDFVDADYTKRSEPTDIIEVLRRL